MHDTTSYHITALGGLASRDLRPDLDGYVHLTAEAVLTGRWDAMADLGDDAAEEIAAANRAATEDSEAAVDDWRADN